MFGEASHHPPNVHDPAFETARAFTDEINPSNKLFHILKVLKGRPTSNLDGEVIPVNVVLDVEAMEVRDLFRQEE